ncbi:MAG: PAS domain S-box protein [Pyrinomonadaceae bacterium]|nr:PAS domain S-box protein [Pyrinomonadaceae bacterium]
MAGSFESFIYLVKNAPFGIFITDVNFRLIEVSECVKKIFDKIEPLIGRDFTEILRIIWKEPFAAQIITHLQYTLSTGDPYHSQYTNKQNGSLKNIQSFDWKIERITLPDEKYGLVCYFYDLTENHKFESQIPPSEDHYRNLFENNPIPMWFFDIKTLQFLKVNEAAIKHYGYSNDEFLAMTIKDIRPLEDVPQLLNKIAGFEKSLNNAGIWNHQKKDGSIIKVEVNTHNIYFEGKPARFVMINDVTENFRSEEGLRLSESRYRMLFEDNPFPMIIYDFDTLKFLDVNEAACLHYGYTREEFLQMTLADVASLDDLQNIKEKVRENNGKLTFYGVWKHRKKDGTEIFVETSSHKLDIEGENSRIVLINDVTEKIKAEVELHEAELRFRATFEQAAVGIAHVSPDGKWLHVNKKLCKITGYTKEELKARNFQDITFPDDLEKDLKLVNKILSGEVESFSMEKRYIRKDKSIVWINLTVALVRDKNGEPKYFISVVEDISHRKSVESELRKWADAFENCAHGIGIGNPQTNRIMAVNSAFANLCGKQKSEIEDQPILSVHHPEIREKIKSALQLSDKEGSVQYESLIKKADGTTFPVQMDVVSVFDNKSGEVLYRVATMQDISARKKAENDLRESEAKLRLFVEFAPASIAMFDREMNYLAVSRRWLSDYQLDQDVIGKNHYEIFPEISEPLKQIYQRALAGSVERSDEDLFERFDGSVQWLKWEARPWLDSSDIIGGIIIFSEDITERKIVEENLRKSEEKLLQAQKLESIGRLAGGIAHDFNNMLTVIKGYSDLSLRQLPIESPVHHYVEEIKMAGNRSASLTYQLLAFSRTQILQPEILNINQIISETTKMLKYMIGEDIQIILQLEPKTGFIKADPGQISQVLMNLLVNARDAMPQGGTITIKTQNIFLESNEFPKKSNEKQRNYIELEISDTGVGMDAVTAANIFEPFFTTKEVGKGTGLGLSTVHGIIEQSGGHIKVKSKMGQGTSFQVLLPQIFEGDYSKIETEFSESLLTGKETILIVEDEELVRKLTRDALLASGYQVIEARNGAEAIKLFENEDFYIDLLMTDIVMPEMSGFELFKKLSQLNCAKPKFLFTSGYFEDERIQNTSFDISENFIQKPFRLDELIHKIQTILFSNQGN